MSIRSCCYGLWRFFSWPFRMLFGCCFKKAPVLPDQNVNQLVGGARRREAKDRRVNPLKQNPINVNFKPLFMISRNDDEYKLARERARKKEERIKAKNEMLAKMEPIPPKPKPRTPSPETDSS